MLVSSRKFTGAEKQSVMVFFRKRSHSVLLIEVKQVLDQEKYSVEALFLISNCLGFFMVLVAAGCFLFGWFGVFLMHYC